MLKNKRKYCKEKAKKNIYKIALLLLIIFIILINNLNVYAVEPPSINAKSAIVVEKNTEKIMYEKDAYNQNYPASVTKILTAILVIENCNLDDIVTVSQTAISSVPSDYVVAPLFVGEQIRVEDLLYALMLKSCNDAAYALAEHVGGSNQGFADMMNKKAEEIGCKNTHFVNPNGIHNNKHYTTAYDLYLISNYAMKNEIFAKIVSTHEYTLPATNMYKSANRVMVNTNQFINQNSSFYDENVKGIKTGTTNQAGNCLITDVEKNGLEYIIVVLGADNAESKFKETKKMIDYVSNNFALVKLHDKGEIITSVDVKNATEETQKLNLVISDEILAMNNVEVKSDEITPEIKITGNLVAPIQEGQQIGTVKYIVEGIEYTADLVAANNVEKKKNYDYIIVGGICAVVILLFITVKEKSKK